MLRQLSLPKSRLLTRSTRRSWRRGRSKPWCLKSTWKKAVSASHFKLSSRRSSKSRFQRIKYSHTLRCAYDRSVKNWKLLIINKRYLASEDHSATLKNSSYSTLIILKKLKPFLHFVSIFHYLLLLFSDLNRQLSFRGFKCLDAGF